MKCPLLKLQHHHIHNQYSLKVLHLPKRPSNSASQHHVPLSTQKTTLFRSNLFKGPASRAKSLIKTLQTPIVPKNIRTSDTFRQAVHRLITPTLSVSGNIPS